MADKKKKQTKNQTPKRTSAAKKTTKAAKMTKQTPKKPAAKKPVAKQTKKVTATKSAAKAPKRTQSKTAAKTERQEPKCSKKLLEELDKKALENQRKNAPAREREEIDEIISRIKNKPQPKRKSAGRRLKRVANIGGYTAWDGRTGKTFATESEAKNYVRDIFIKTGELVQVTRTQRTVTHTYKSENKADK